MTDEERAAILAAFDQLQSALRACDGEGAAEAMRRIYEVEPAVADTLINNLITTGLRNMVYGTE
ncbi:hypothetical protein [Planobispora takensis]|uniref:Uncharacterized protein n=1 Tax=Planobispora takensis TaxID=1367882 RepID=A0A8J3T6D7_9ACTN|nr:hypothetical protein [Planobispora takensis]GII05750.1 hypothetical protein Pta02_77580 [Planobispora takensis]